MIWIKLRIGRCSELGVRPKKNPSSPSGDILRVGWGRLAAVCAVVFVISRKTHWPEIRHLGN